MRFHSEADKILANRKTHQERRIKVRVKVNVEEKSSNIPAKNRQEIGKISLKTWKLM